jgi:hypothetical protein
MAKKTKVQKTDIITLPCGCIYQDKGWLLTRIKECDYHKRKRTTKRPYRPNLSRMECQDFLRHKRKNGSAQNAVK